MKNNRFSSLVDRNNDRSTSRVNQSSNLETIEDEEFFYGNKMKSPAANALASVIKTIKHKHVAESQ